MRGHAAFMGAFFAFGGGLFATGLLVFCRERQTRQKDCRASRSNESFDEFHVSTFLDLTAGNFTAKGLGVQQNLGPKTGLDVGQNFLDRTTAPTA